jgi:hypothetical protein
VRFTSIPVYSCPVALEASTSTLRAALIAEG